MYLLKEKYRKLTLKGHNLHREISKNLSRFAIRGGLIRGLKASESGR